MAVTSAPSSGPEEVNMVKRWNPFGQWKGKFTVKLEDEHRDVVYEKCINVGDKMEMTVLQQDLKKKGIDLHEL